MSDIKGISLSYYTHKILMEDDYKPVVQPQRHLNPKVQDVVKNEIVKLLDSGLIYPISDNSWVSPIRVVPKKGGMTIVLNDNNELIPSRTITGWRVCIDYRKLNDATQKDHFPLPFIDQMLEHLCGNEYYCFLDGFSGFFQIPIAPEDQEKTTFTCPYGTFAYRRMSFGLCNAPATFQRCMTAIFHDMVEDFIMLARCEETNLVLNWEKCHFMVKEGTVLGHKISRAGIEVDRAKIDVIAKLPYPTNVKGVRSFLRHARFYRSKEDTKPRLIRRVLLLQGFDIEINDKKGAKNLAADHLSRLESQDLGTFIEEEITNEFPDEHLMILKAELNNDEPWGRHSASITRRKVYESGFYWPSIFKDYVMRCDACQRSGNISSRSEMLQNNIQAFRTAYKMPTRCTPFRLVYGKACHLPMEIEHKAYWALKQCNMDLTAAAKNCFMELNELMELRDRVYENTQIYKERTKRWHDSGLRGDTNFKVGDKVEKYHNGHINEEEKEVVELDDDTT
ncbi:reverse transcriptase domain-containing protein [Tanacetum coccineum]